MDQLTISGEEWNSIAEFLKVECVAQPLWSWLIRSTVIFFLVVNHSTRVDRSDPDILPRQATKKTGVSLFDDDVFMRL